MLLSSRYRDECNARDNHDHLALSCIFALLLVACPLTEIAATEVSGEISGTELAQMVYDRPSGDDASSKVIMVLQGEGKKARRRLMYSYSKDKGNSERWTLLRFVDPKEVEKTGLLTLDYKGDESDQWLYLPALDRVRRISSARKGGRFVGSDFYYEDLKDREVQMDNHTLLGKAKMGGIECYILESIPVDPDNSVYTRRVSWIHPGLLLPLKVEFYEDKGDTPSKRLQAKKIKKIQGYWTVFQSTMYNLKKGHKTLLATSDILYDQDLPDELFTQRGLADDNIELSFRP